MAKKLNLAEMISGEMSKLDTMRVQELPLARIDTNPDNHYSLSDIDELAESIAVVGLQQPLVVQAAGDRYLLLAGHRRRAALEKLGRTSAPCVVQPADMDPAIATLVLHWTNTMARGGASYGIGAAGAARDIENALLDLKTRGMVELPGKLREHVAAVMHESESKLARIKAIDRNLIPAWKKKFKANKINESVAYELQQCDEETQNTLYKVLESTLLRIDAKVIKAGRKVSAYEWATLVCPYSCDQNYSPEFCTGVDKRAAAVKRGDCPGCCKDCDKADGCSMVCGQRSTRDRKAADAAERQDAFEHARTAFFASHLGRALLHAQKVIADAGLTAEAADVASWNFNPIAQCESHYSAGYAAPKPLLSDIIKIADALGITVGALLGEGEDKNAK